MRFKCGNRKSKPPRAPRLQGTIYLSILYPPWLPGQKGQCHKPLWQYAVVLWTDLDRGCWDGHKMPTGWTFALQPCKTILFRDVSNVCQDQAELRGNYDRLCISCNYILINANIGLINPPLVGQSDLLASFLDRPLIISNSEPKNFGYGLRQLDLNRIPLDLLKSHGSERWLINQGQTVVIINGGHGLMGGTLWELSKLMIFIKILIRNRSFGE